MKFVFTLAVFAAGLFIHVFAQKTNTDILLMGSDHLSQLYKKEHPHSDVLNPKRQKELAEFLKLSIRYQPDMIMVEVLPEYQGEMDSLFTLYLNNRLKLEDLPDGRSEVYQVAFRMAKQLGLPGVYCVNAPGGTSQSILDNGENIGLYKEETSALREMVGKKVSALQSDSLSLKDYLVFLNQPETYNRVYRLRYMTPARVTNGRFVNPDRMVDTAFVNPKYIGAELTAVFKNRDYKIYSNIVTTAMKTKPRRILLIIGVAHIGSLKSIFRDDPEFNVIDANQVLTLGATN